ncbi:quinoprotein dehydrogenase-associated SoxYZ-like carrier [Enterovibrio norvegicus FF-454]|uniref:Quinoprotein dehydrogenase-associated SoxYZ-like carrier n=1 Tax=Enterovibrio norvegicus FF-454 TaxID=1185651 RepID=A0A1E5C4Q6_9GAMM|nr:quinoprotein dehydrogenase-associated SoxYZ-like carrier [Enterovibrio norvegicus]OEE60511.1 quinoprotein dehydrogenase-associated SoxYZ-like carrier [Enterovibrio norvegicus FF-454]
MKKIALLLSAVLALLPMLSFAQSEQESMNWPLIRDSLFPGSPEIIEDDVVTLISPVRALDAALVPLEIKVNVRQDDPNPIETIHLIVDNNPSPIVGTFDMSPNNGVANISTRVRVNAYSPVRVIAKTADGKLHMASNFVKASGGCSAPAGADDLLARQRMGKMKLKDLGNTDTRMLQLLISHPNYSGLQIDQVTRHWIPSDYVSDVQITLEGEPVMQFNGGISISENPTFTFHVDAEKRGKLKADVKDSAGREFSSEWDI